MTNDQKLSRCLILLEVAANHHRDIEQRVRRLERFQYMTTGGAILLSALVGLLAHLLH